MKRKERASRSTYRAILNVQQARDDPSGLYVSDRFFEPSRESGNHPVLWYFADVLLLACLAMGLLMLLTTGFSVAAAPWFFPGAVGLCAGMVLVIRSSLCRRFWAPTAMILLLGYLLVVYLNQDDFLIGMRQFGGLISYTIQKTYADEAELIYPGQGTEVSLFLLLLAFPGVVWLALSLFLSNVFLMAYLLIFPLVALLALCGAAKDSAAMFLILFGIVLGMAFSRPRKQHRMWGGKNRKLFRENRLRFESIQKKTAAAVLLACIVVSVPGFLVVTPMLSLQLKPMEQLSMQLQSNFLNRVRRLLPELTAGQWNLNLEAIGGGVQNGELNSTEGYLLEGVEDLRLTLNYKPQQPLFLRGYVGKKYENGSWGVGSGATFDGAAMTWNTEGSPRIYIQNLPFLRTAFASAGAASQNPEAAAAMAGISAQPRQLLVERINANDSYTYVPYGVYLNEYYRVDSGDCAVEGQKEQEDRFLFFTREDMETVLEAWNELEDTANVLDRVEESYRAFCQTDCAGYPEGLEPFYAEIRQAMSENKWRSQDNLPEITAWIRRYLAENYTYQLLPDEVPEGTDALQFFLSESKRGNSVHFASAAVVFYRMFGIPARYVVGYEIPAALFTAQANGIYTATVQGDNSQAWAEIYIPGIGWMPRDMTPGIIGTYEEVGPGGEKIEAVIEDPTEPEETLPTESLPEVPEEILLPEPEGRAWTVRQIIVFFLGLLLAALMLVGMTALGRRIFRTYGFRFPGRDRQTRLLGVFQAFCRRMYRLGLPRQTDSQQPEFAAFCTQQLRLRDSAAEESFAEAMEYLYSSCFGSRTVQEEDILRMRRLLRTSRKRPRRR